ncbi:hypothetical protein M413DRAFT_204630 [Hebeloma cylindrosporum]|uniref:Uncharacterized protein n=1 Tax=Hebeloma cylindrosporum TaxID=76867 RepID=A0A0C3CUV2_HEBCY|nr:hypothetical protein M413DRAFT_204630 [Hebeloma cylindrosporum h7]
MATGALSLAFLVRDCPAGCYIREISINKRKDSATYSGSLALEFFFGASWFVAYLRSVPLLPSTLFVTTSHGMHNAPMTTPFPSVMIQWHHHWNGRRLLSLRENLQGATFHSNAPTIAIAAHKGMAHAPRSSTGMSIAQSPCFLRSCHPDWL